MSTRKRRVSDELLLQTILANPGATEEELGAILNLSRVQVSRRKALPEFKALLADQHKGSIDLLRRFQHKAVRRICELMDSEDERIALRAAEVVLEKASSVPERKEESAVRERMLAAFARVEARIKARNERL